MSQLSSTAAPLAVQLLTQIILIIARRRAPVNELRLRFGEEGGEVKREGNSPLTSQASYRLGWAQKEEKKQQREQITYKKK